MEDVRRLGPSAQRELPSTWYHHQWSLAERAGDWQQPPPAPALITKTIGESHSEVGKAVAKLNRHPQTDASPASLTVAYTVMRKKGP